MIPTSICIERARRLDASDGLGRKSDPYVKLYWRSAESAAWVDAESQTKVVKANLNPAWNEALHFELEKGKSPALKLEVYDHDIIGSSDLLGSAIVPLGRDNYVGWAKLTGKQGELLRGEVRVSAGFGEEIDAPPAEALTSSVQLNIVGAHHLKAQDTNGKSDPYLTIWSRPDEQCAWVKSGKRTASQPATLAPTWLEDFTIDIEAGSAQQIKLVLMDKDTIGADDALGNVVYTLGEDPITGWREVEDGSGEVQASVGYAPFDPPAPEPVTTHLATRVYVHNARRLKSSDLHVVGTNGSSDPYVRVWWRADDECAWVDAEQKTPVVKKTLDPDWGSVQLDFKLEKVRLRASYLFAFLSLLHTQTRAYTYTHTLSHTHSLSPSLSPSLASFLLPLLSPLPSFLSLRAPTWRSSWRSWTKTQLEQTTPLEASFSH